MGGKVITHESNSDEFYPEFFHQNNVENIIHDSRMIMSTHLVLTSVVNLIVVKAFSNFSHSFKAF